MKFKHLVMSLLWVVVMILGVDNWCNGCLEEERFALLQLKASINYPSHTYLPSWEEDDDHSDCCQWEGVECNSTTRRLIKLSLNNTRDWIRDDYWYLNASILLPFESLRRLDLRGNRLGGFFENKEFDGLNNLKILNLRFNELGRNTTANGLGILYNLRNLEDLYLRHNAFDNSILPDLNKLSNLQILDLAANELNGTIDVKEFDGLSNLKELDLRWNHIITINDLGTLSNLRNLEDLNLGGNALDNSILPYVNKLSNLKILGLAGNNLNGKIDVKGSHEKSGMNNLEVLDLSSNELNGTIGSFLRELSSLKTLDLSYNYLYQGAFDNSGLGIFSNLRNLEDLYLRGNALDNSILPYVNKLSNLKILDLAYNELNGTIDVKEFDGLSNLKELDLSMNHIITINGLGILSNLRNLEDLYLRHNAFDNSILPDLNKLSNLQILDLAANELNGTIDVKEFDGLSNLKELDLSSNHIITINGLCELKTIRELDIKGNGLGGTLPSCLMNLTSLRLLDISSNQFRGNVAMSPLVNLTSLEYLIISDNEFDIPISFKSFSNHSKLKFIESLNNKLLEEEDILARSPSFQLIGFYLSGPEHGRIIRSFPYFLYHQHDLVELDLSGFYISGEFPNWLLENNTRMKILYLPNNSFCGQLSLPSRPMKNLLALDISNNHLEGIIPYETSRFFPSIKYLKMSRNDFEGNIPSSFGNMTALQILDLSNNRLSGEIPVNLAKDCWSLEALMLSNNKLEGPILPYQNNLTSLVDLYLDGNGFTEIPHSLLTSHLLVNLNINQNQLVGKIPRWLGNLSSLEIIGMANNHLEGSIPMEFGRLNYLFSLDLSRNNITGVIPSCLNMTKTRFIKLSKNRLHGHFPTAFRNSTFLIMLDLSDNQFTGKIPNWIGNLSELSILLLKNNRFEGIIPDQLCHISQLSMIDLSFNNFSGSIPRCMNTIKFEEEPGKHSIRRYSLDIQSPLFTSLSHDLVMVPKINIHLFQISISIGQVEFKTKGTLLYYEGVVLDLFSGINLSYNNLSGYIPLEIGNLSHIKTLNLAHNNLTGTIPATFSNLKNIESMDLSYNYLDGKIPSQLTELISLEVFNVSFNNLSGSTPQRVAQFATFESSSYVGNPLLCGEPLPKCNSNDSRPSTARVINGSEEDSNFLNMDMDVLYMSFAGSYVTVVMAIVAVLYINPHWRRVWFHLIEVFITSCYYFVVDNLVWPRRGFLSR